jgi:SnoaL-like domain
MNPRLQALCDRADILDCMYRYARGMDRLDRELLRSAYHDDAIDDHVGFLGPVDDFIDWTFAYHSSQTRHQHFLMNHTAEVSGDQAHTEMHYLFVGTDAEPAKPLIVSGGRYVDRLERRSGRWGIVARVCLVEWRSEAGSLLSPQAVKYVDCVQSLSRDRRDASYDRPLDITPDGGEHMSHPRHSAGRQILVGASLLVGLTKRWVGLASP